MKNNNIEVEEKFQEVISEMLNILGLSATIIVDTVEIEDKKYLKVDLQGEELGVLIGYHGKTLEALKKVLFLMAPTEGEQTYGVLLDINGYHLQREEYIRKLCVSVAEQVRMTTQPMELMPMKASERRVVHMVLQNEEDLETESIGEEPDRRVVVKLKKK